jgi:single-strand DNA-binding protein
MNLGMFVGRLGKDAEMKYTPSGKAVTNFSIAVDVGYGDNKSTLWIEGVLWEKRAETLTQYLTKGKQIAIAGPIELRTWINKNTGEAQGSIRVNVDKLTLCGGGQQAENGGNAGGNNQARTPKPATQPPQDAPISDEDIPF